MIGIDLDVKSWLTDLRLNGLNASPLEVIALSRFVKRARANGYWTKLLEVYPFCGTSLAASMYKLKYPSGLTRALTWGGAKLGSFPDEKYYNSRFGFKGAGDQNYMMTSDFIPSINIASSASTYISVRVRYPNENDLNQNENLFGNNGTPGALSISLNSNSFQTQLNHTANISASDGNDQYGHLQANRRDGNIYFFRDGVSMGGATPQAPTGLATQVMNATGRANFQEGTYIYSFGSIGEGFLDADCEALGADVVILMNDLRRM